MNSPRYITASIFVIITSSFVAAHLLFKPDDHELIWVQVPQSSSVGGGSINAVSTPLTAPPATIALERSDIKAAFERETVISLNGIVRRSLIVIREYDAEINAIRIQHTAAMRQEATEAQRADARANLMKLQSWVGATSLAVRDMNTAVLKLEASEENYNAAILAGMVRFVNTVAEEISTEHTRITEEQRLASL
ncbi:MAG: hypothetical protein AAF699_06695 [Pseudomonadota bacterium]